MKRLRVILLVGMMLCAVGCQKQEVAPENTMDKEPEAVVEKPQTVEEEPAESGLEAAFADCEKMDLNDEDFTFEYNGNTFSVSSNWNEYVDALGYPEEYEENNYGYINTNDDGYYWGMRYPTQQASDDDFYVVFYSPSLDREGEDTLVHHISLGQVPTARGIRMGNSVDDVAAAYGKPDSIATDESNVEWMDVTYTYMEHSIQFVVADNKVLFINMYP